MLAFKSKVKRKVRLTDTDTWNRASALIFFPKPILIRNLKRGIADILNISIGTFKNVLSSENWNFIFTMSNTLILLQCYVKIALFTEELFLLFIRSLQYLNNIDDIC